MSCTMAKSKINCPSCDTVLSVSHVSGKIRCPKCSEVFSAAPSHEEAITAKRISTPSRPARREDHADDDEVAAPRRRRRFRPEQEGSGAGWIVALVAASLLTAAGVGLGVCFLFRPAMQEHVAEIRANAQPIQQTVATTLQNPLQTNNTQP